MATELLARAERDVADIDLALLRAGLTTLFREVDPKTEDPDHLQPLAAAAAVLQRVSVIAGGPGTGKTTTVARLLALLHQQALAQGAAPPLIALAAPTGKAALRLEEAVRDEALRLDLDAGTEERLLELRGMTLHRLLGRAGGNRTRFRHNATNPLRHDVVVVDETSMVALSMMARLLEALRPDARLIIVGDHEQLASVEAGAVLGDIVGPAARGLCMDQAVRARLEEATGHPVPDTGHDGALAHRGRGRGVASRPAPRGRHRRLRPGGPGRGR